MMIDNLRLFLGGLAANRLMEAMMRDCLAIGVYSDKCPDGVFLPPGCLEQVGFDPGEGLLDADPRTLPAYRLLWEFFALPDKFRLLQLNLQDAWSLAAGSECSIVFYFSRQHPQIQRQIAIESVQLGCVPVINLFEHSAEPISVDETQYRYRVIPTHRAPHSMEIHSIVSVEATRTAGDKKIEYLPFHRPQHPQDLGDPQRFWHATRIFKPTENEGADSGSEIELAIVDLQGRPSPKDQWTLHVQTQCCNRDLVNHLSVSSRLRCTSGAIRTTFSTSPTPTRRPVSDDQWHWRLISHLSVNLLSLAEDRNAELLKETLSLYLSEDERDAKEIRYKAIDAIQSVSYQRDTARMLNPHGGQGVCRGIRIVLEVDEERLEVLGTYLICSILDRFFALFATINSWTQLTVLSKGAGGREVYRGPRRTGLRELL